MIGYVWVIFFATLGVIGGSWFGVQLYGELNLSLYMGGCVLGLAIGMWVGRRVDETM